MVLVIHISLHIAVPGPGGGGSLVYKVRYRLHNIVFCGPGNVHAMHTSIRGAKAGKIGKISRFLVMVTNLKKKKEQI